MSAQAHRPWTELVTLDPGEAAVNLSEAMFAIVPGAMAERQIVVGERLRGSDR